MKGFGKNGGTGREGARPVSGAEPPSMGRRVVSGLAAFALMVLLVAEVIVVVSYFTPTMAILLYQYSTISIHETIALGDFAMRDMVFLMMMYGAPFIVMCGLIIRAEWLVMRKMGGLVWRLIMVSAGRDAGIRPAGKGDADA